jgi:hypothetical protein
MKTQLLALREHIAAAGLDSLADAIMAQARPAVDLVLDGASSGEIGECRFGGAPDLPPSMAWPRDADGKAFVFLLQLNLAQVPAFEENPLPPRGILWLFLGLDEPASDVEHRIIIWQGEEELRPAPTPPNEEFINDAYADIAPLRLRLELRADVPHYSTDYEGLGERMSGAEQDAYDALVPRGGGHIGHLLGHVHGVGHDPREDAFVVREANAAWLYDYKQRAGLDMNQAHAWRNLVCLSSFRSGEVDFCVWDAGLLAFLIHQDDLQKLDFSRVYASVESS